MHDMFSSIESPNRRKFMRSLGTTGTVALANTVLPAFATGPTIAQVRNPPMAVAMWDYSWLTRRFGKETEYLNFDKILDAFILRGYNGLRIDAFPHLIANDINGLRQEVFTMLPQPGSFPWGNHAKVDIQPRRDLIVFLGKCRQRGIRVGLSTWLQNDTTKRATQVASPRHMARIWRETLKWIEQNGLLDVIEWVDFLNEFPSPVFAPSVVNYMNQFLNRKISLMAGGNGPLPPDKEQGRVISDYMRESLSEIKVEFPDLKFCYSLNGDGTADYFQHVDLSFFDLLEPHIWLNQNLGFGVASALHLNLINMPTPVPYLNYLVALRSPKIYAQMQKGLSRWLETAMDSWVNLANQLQVPLYTTEAWSAINYYDIPNHLIQNEKEWDWIFVVSVLGAKMAKARGWTGICTANFCQPQFPGFYQNIAWHQEVTKMILA